MGRKTFFVSFALSEHMHTKIREHDERGTATREDTRGNNILGTEQGDGSTADAAGAGILGLLRRGALLPFRVRK